MIKPHGSDNLCPLFVVDKAQNSALLKEAETLPKLLLDSAAAANAVMLGAGYFTPLKGYMNLQDALDIAETMQTSAGLFWPVPCLNRASDVNEIKDTKRIAWVTTSMASAFCRTQPSTRICSGSTGNSIR